MSTAIEQPFGDGDYLFNLRLKQLEELQEKTGFGPFRSLQRLFEGDAFVSEIAETIRLGLVGGGTDPVEARKLVSRYVDDCPLAPNRLLAQAVLAAVTIGLPDAKGGEEDEPGKSQTEGE